MRNFTIYLALTLCLFASKMLAQETFEARAKAIALKIEKIAKEEKETLKLEVESVNVQLENNSITKQQADDKRTKRRATPRAPDGLFRRARCWLQRRPSRLCSAHRQGRRAD